MSALPKVLQLIQIVASLDQLDEVLVVRRQGELPHLLLMIDIQLFDSQENVLIEVVRLADQLHRGFDHYAQQTDDYHSTSRTAMFHL